MRQHAICILLLTAFLPAQREAEPELLALRERLYVLREARRPDKVLETTVQIIKLDPRDPWPHFIMGEVYMSFGKHYNRKKATASLKKFLKLAGPKPDENVTGHNVISREDRLVAHRYLLRIEDDKPAMILTPSSVIRDRIRAVTKGIKKNEKARLASRDTIRMAENYINNIRRTGSRVAASHIASKRRMITKAEAKIEKADDYIRIQQEEIQALEQELAQRPAPSPVKLTHGGRKK